MNGIQYPAVKAETTRKSKLVLPLDVYKIKIKSYSGIFFH